MHRGSMRVMPLPSVNYLLTTTLGALGCQILPSFSLGPWVYPSLSALFPVQLLHITPTLISGCHLAAFASPPAPSP